MVTKTVTVARLLVTRAATAMCVLLPAWVCMSIRLAMYSSYYYLLLLLLLLRHSRTDFKTLGCRKSCDQRSFRLVSRCAIDTDKETHTLTEYTALSGLMGSREHALAN